MTQHEYFYWIKSAFLPHRIVMDIRTTTSGGKITELIE
jgi:hypothetical protein